MSEKLLSCPFCGGVPSIESDNKIFARKVFENYPANHSIGFRIRCDKCGCQTCWWHYKKEALTAWNTRQALADNALAIKIYEKIKELGLAPLNGWSCYNSSCVFDIYVKGKSKCCLGFNRSYEENYNKYKRCGSHDLEACAKFFGGSDEQITK